METRSRRSTLSPSASRSSASETALVDTTDDFKLNEKTMGAVGETPEEHLVLGSAGGGVGDTPVRTRGLEQLRQKIEEELGKGRSSVGSEDTASPGLTRLRNTPGRGLKEKQKELIQKHEQIRQNSDKLSVGGGVTLWPEMRRMRLSGREVGWLVVACLVLMATMGALFVYLHGETFRTIRKLTAVLTEFDDTHPIRNTGFQINLKSSLLAWHSDFRKLLDGVDKSLNVSRPSGGYQAYIACYLLCLGVLVYFLADNMVSNNKLSPSRIKKWVCLLVVVAQWSAMLLAMFLYAYTLESAIIHNVHQLSEKLGEFVERDLDLTTLSVVVEYWRGRCLPPASRGVLRVVGVVSLQDLAIYLQFYSLPLLTVLLTPPLRLCLALSALYASPQAARRKWD